MEARPQEALLALGQRPAEAQDNGLLLGADGEEPGGQKDGDQDEHDELDDDETTPQGFGEGLRAGIERCLHRGGTWQGPGLGGKGYVVHSYCSSSRGGG